MSEKKNTPLMSIVLTGLVALALFLPLSGVVLKGYEFTFEFQRPLLLAGGVVLLKALQIFLASRKKVAIPSIDFAFMESTKAKILMLLILCVLPFFLGRYWLGVVNLALIYVLLGLGLNVVVGLAGLLDLGFVAFYAVGAYGYALGYELWGFWAGLPMAAIMAACAGTLLGFPVLRMHGDYLAIVTLGFGEIIRLVLNNWTEVTGGPNGVSAPFPTLFGLEFTRRSKQGGTPLHEFFGFEYIPELRYIFLYFLILIFCIAIIYALGKVRTMSIGRAWEALREDEIACRSLGINHVVVKLSAFSMGASIGGIAGVFFAASSGFINPASFNFFESALILAIVVLGGLGSTTGVVVAAVVLTLLPEFLRDISDYRFLAFGLLMVVMMIWRPRGFFRFRRPVHLKGGP